MLSDRRSESKIRDEKRERVGTEMDGGEWRKRSKRNMVGEHSEKSPDTFAASQAKITLDRIQHSGAVRTYIELDPVHILIAV